MDITERPSSHIVRSIITLCLFCLPLGIIAVIYSANVMSAIASGQIALARRYSEKARFWGNLGICIGICLPLTLLVLHAWAGLLLK